MHLRSSDSDQHSLHPPSNERLFLPTTAFNRFAVTREIDEASGERIGSQPRRFCLDGARGRLNARGLCIHKGVMATTGSLLPIGWNPSPAVGTSACSFGAALRVKAAPFGGSSDRLREPIGRAA